jgi:hypothetical protein
MKSSFREKVRMRDVPQVPLIAVLSGISLTPALSRRERGKKNKTTYPLLSWNPIHSPSVGSFINNHEGVAYEKHLPDNDGWRCYIIAFCLRHINI